MTAVRDAARHEPVTIRRQNRAVAVVISSSDSQRLTSNNVEAFQRFCDRISEAAKARGMTEEKLGLLLSN